MHVLTKKSISQIMSLEKPGLQLRVRNRILIFLFLNPNICCWYTKDSSQRGVSFEIQNMCEKLLVRKYFQFYTENLSLSNFVKNVYA